MAPRLSGGGPCTLLEVSSRRLEVLGKGATGPVVFSGSLTCSSKILNGRVRHPSKSISRAKKTPVKESHSSNTNVSVALEPQSVAGDNSKKYDNKPGNGGCLAMGRKGVSLHPHLLKDSCVALLMKCVITMMSYTDYGDDRATMLNVLSVCSENARWHGTVWARWACQTSTGVWCILQRNLLFLPVRTSAQYDQTGVRRQDCKL
jgi:hypothetical protein